MSTLAAAPGLVPRPTARPSGPPSAVALDPSVALGQSVALDPTIDTCTPMLQGRTAGLVAPDATKAICVRPVQRPVAARTAVAAQTPAAAQAPVAAESSSSLDILSWCATHPDAWYNYRYEACESGHVFEIGLVTVGPNPRLDGTVTFETTRYAWSTTGVVRWAEIVTVARLAFTGNGASAIYDVDMSCIGSCVVESADAIGPTPSGETASGTWYLTSTIASTNGTVGFGRSRMSLIVTAPGYTTGSASADSAQLRCDYAINLFALPGCVFPSYWPVAQWSYSEPAFWEVTHHIFDAQAAGRPGRPGTAPLSRLVDLSLQTLNRNTACPQSFPTGPGQSCDEYPFASTRQGAYTSGSLYSARAVNETHNSDHGTALGNFYRDERVLDDDRFWVQIIGAPGTPGGGGGGAGGSTVMVVGDSISQGLEGDYTWRYRLQQHLSTTGANVNFVGPYTGTNRVADSLPAGFPQVAPPPVFYGAYRGGLTFDSDHFAQWGRQAHQAKDDVYARVSQYRPDYLLVELGFNDLGWGVSSAAGLTADIQGLIANARAAKPDIKILVANVVHRTPLPNLPTLDALINSYNSGLGAALQSVNTGASPVRLVDISSDYVPAGDTYDGLHPNGVGEYKIARRFANALSGQFGLGGTFGSIPSSVPELIPEKPFLITANPTDAGITLTWGHSFGAAGYWLWARDATLNESFQQLPLAIPADSWKVTWVQVGHTYEYKVVPTRGNDGPASDVASAVANPKTAAGPPAPVTLPGDGYIDVSWQAATGPYTDTLTGYNVYYDDYAVSGSIVQVKYTTGLSIRLSGLVNGHPHAIAVSSVNAIGEGMPSGAPTAIPWPTGPQTPTLVSAKLTSIWDVQLTWTEVPAAAGYMILVRDAVAGAPFSRLPYPVTGGSFAVGWLFAGSDRFEFCIVAINGSRESSPSNCLRGSP